MCISVESELRSLASRSTRRLGDFKERAVDLYSKYPRITLAAGTSIVCAALAVSVFLGAGQTVDNTIYPKPKPTATFTSAEVTWKQQIQDADNDPSFRSWLWANHPIEAAERFGTPEPYKNGKGN